MPRTLAFLLAGLLALPLPAAALQNGDADGGGLALTTASSEAAAAFRTALFEVQNAGAQRALPLLRDALAADSAFGLARVLQAVLETGLAPEERERRAELGLGDMGGASAPELLLALYWRESAAGRGAAALPTLRAATEMAPGSPELALMYATQSTVGRPAAERLALLRKHTERFPDHAGAFNLLAYTAWRAGEADAALPAVRRYVELAPAHPNSLDSYADILILLGLHAEAVPHIERAIRTDPGFGAPHVKLGAVRLMLGDPAGARAAFEEGERRAATPGARFNHAHWRAAAHLEEGDRDAALRALRRIAEEAGKAGAPLWAGQSHGRAAAVEAFGGSAASALEHIRRDAAAGAEPPASHYWYKAVVHSRTGERKEARAAAQRFESMVSATSSYVPTLRALLALDMGDLGTARTELDRALPHDPLAQALRAELMERTGEAAQAEALRREVLAGSLKVDGNTGIDDRMLVARLRLRAR